MKSPAQSKLPSIVQSLWLIANPIHFLNSCGKRHGDCFSLSLLGSNSSPVVFLSNPVAINQIFTTSQEKFELGKVSDVFLPLVGKQSLIMLKGNSHQKMRNLLLPPLHGKAITRYGELIVKLTEEAIASWQPTQTVSIRQSMTEISLAVILRAVFGVNRGKTYDLLKRLIDDLLEYVNSPLNSIQFFWPPLQQDLGRWSPWGKFIWLRQQIDELVYAEINERRINNSPEGDDILSLLMAATDEEGKHLSDSQLKDQLMTLLLLGHETTASALAWAFYWIHKIPSVKEKLQQELDGLNGNKDFLEISKLPYLNAICTEALRIYPIALISQPRFVKETVEIGGYKFEPGTILVPCIYLAHHRAETFAEPEKFLPERFLEQKFSPYEYFPFGGGTRSCIGMSLSLFEMKLVLATVLSSYELELCTKYPVKPVRRGITIVPSGGCQMIVKQPRNVNLNKLITTHS